VSGLCDTCPSRRTTPCCARCRLARRYACIIGRAVDFLLRARARASLTTRRRSDVRTASFIWKLDRTVIIVHVRWLSDATAGRTKPPVVTAIFLCLLRVYIVYTRTRCTRRGLSVVGACTDVVYVCVGPASVAAKTEEDGGREECASEAKSHTYYGQTTGACLVDRTVRAHCAIVGRYYTRTCILYAVSRSLN